MIGIKSFKRLLKRQGIEKYYFDHEPYLNELNRNLSNMNKIIIGITTFNRKNILVKMAKSFSECTILDSSKIIIFDDHSSEYGEIFLSNLFPNAQIFINECNIGADNNLYAMYQYFLKTDGDILFNIDSDLIGCHSHAAVLQKRGSLKSQI